MIGLTEFLLAFGLGVIAGLILGMIAVDHCQKKCINLIKRD